LSLYNFNNNVMDIYLANTYWDTTMDGGGDPTGPDETPPFDPRPEVPSPNIPEETPPYEREPETPPIDPEPGIPPVEPVVPEVEPLRDPGGEPGIPAFN
jgi:hypothetical protein